MSRSGRCVPGAIGTASSYKLTAHLQTQILATFCTVYRGQCDLGRTEVYNKDLGICIVFLIIELGREIPQLMGELPSIAQFTISRLTLLIYLVELKYIGWDLMLTAPAMSYYTTMVSDIPQFRRHKIADVNRGRMGQADCYPAN